MNLFDQRSPSTCPGVAGGPSDARAPGTGWELIGTLTIPGRAYGMGSKSAIPLKNRRGGLVMKAGRNGPTPVIALTDDAGEKGRSWSGHAKALARIFARDCGLSAPLACPIRLEARFVFERPKTHFERGRKYAGLGPKPDAPHWFDRSPDLDKLCRRLCDALTGIVYVDDRQVVELAAKKRYTRSEREAQTEVMVWRWMGGAQ